MESTNWLKFAQICRESFDTCTFQEVLIDKCGSSEDIAWAVYFHLGGGSLAWLDRNIPALAGAKPADLIRAGASDQVRVSPEHAVLKRHAETNPHSNDLPRSTRKNAIFPVDRSIFHQHD